MAEDYVRPVTSAREPRPAWREALAFRTVGVLVVLAIAYAVFFLVFHLHITGAGNAQG